MGKFIPIIPKGTPVPIKRSLIATTLEKTQTSVMINLYEGEHEDVQYNNYLGALVLRGLSSKEKKQAKDKRVELTFTIDAKGTLVSVAMFSISVRMIRFIVAIYFSFFLQMCVWV
jgi:molecular chaperone DnaK